MGVPRRTGALLVYAGTVGLAITFLVCAYLYDILHAIRGWRCSFEDCSIPAAWAIDQTRDTFLLWLGGLRSVLQIRAGMAMQHGVDRRAPLVHYLAVAALDFVLLASLHQLPAWVLALVAGWPLLVLALSRSASVRPLVWEQLAVPRARVVSN